MMPKDVFSPSTNVSVRLTASLLSRDCRGASSAIAAAPSVTAAVSTSAASSRGRRPNRTVGRIPADSLTLRKAISGSAYGDDQARLLRGRLELFAQVADVNVDRARVAVCGIAPDRPQQLLAVEQPPGLVHQAGEQLELREGQAHRSEEHTSELQSL